MRLCTSKLSDAGGKRDTLIKRGANIEVSVKKKRFTNLANNR